MLDEALKSAIHCFISDTIQNYLLFDESIAVTDLMDCTKSKYTEADDQFIQNVLKTIIFENGFKIEDDRIVQVKLCELLIFMFIAIQITEDAITSNNMQANVPAGDVQTDASGGDVQANASAATPQVTVNSEGLISIPLPNVNPPAQNPILPGICSKLHNCVYISIQLSSC